MQLKPIKTKLRKERAGSSPVRRPAARSPKPALPLLKEEFLAMAFRLSPHPIGITELETGRCLEINDACLEIFGFRREEVIGRTTLMLGIWPDREERARLIERVKTERSVRDVEVTMRTKPRDQRTFLISVNLVKLGRNRCLLTIGNDITERTQAEDALRQLNATLEHHVAERTVALRESEERFRAFLDHAPNLAFIKALDGRYLYANRRFQEAFGLDQKNLVGKTDTELFPREQADQFQSNDHRVLELGTAMEFEELALYTNGPRTNLVVKFPLRDESGHIYATGGIVTDITDRKKSENEVRRSQSFTTSVVDNLPNMVFVKDAKDLRFVRLNKAGERLLGYSEQQLLGKNDYDFFPKTEADFFTSKDREVLASGRLLDIPEEPIKTRDGTIRLLHTKKIPIPDQEGKPLYLLGISEDITERKQVEEELLRNQELLQQQRMQLEDLTSKLITAQEHERRRIARELHDDFSQRMAALVLDVATIEQQPSVLPEQLADLLCPVRERLEQLSDDIHNLAYKLHPSLLEHAGLPAAVEDHLRELINRTALTISYKAHHIPESLSLDYSTGLFRVLQESLQNVVKHAKATQVSVKLSGSSKGVGLSVADNGTGFDAQDTSAHQKGLGLINMQERLRLLGGFLRIHARPGDGTKVCAWIPLKGAAS
jgi:PAS domain S-box-containing protein